MRTDKKQNNFRDEIPALLLLLGLFTILSTYISRYIPICFIQSLLCNSCRQFGQRRLLRSPCGEVGKARVEKEKEKKT